MALHPLIIDVEVSPTQGKHGWWIEHGERIKTYHKEPESRDTNEYLIHTIAEALHTSHSHISIIKGAESRFKEIRIGVDITREEFLKKLNVHLPEEK